MEHISAKELLRIYVNNPNCLIIDVRPEGDYAKGHIPSSFNIPLDILIKKCMLYLNKDFTYYIICDSGFKSRNACKFLLRNYYKVINIEDGFDSWEGPIERARQFN